MFSFSLECSLLMKRKTFFIHIVSLLCSTQEFSIMLYIMLMLKNTVYLYVYVVSTD